MSYANGTTHYNLPQTLGTDKRDWFDTNQAFADVDAALYAAATGQTADAEAIVEINQKLVVDEQNIADLQTLTSTHTSQISSLQTIVNTQANQISDTRQDAEDMISAYNEGAAETSTHAYAIGDYFIYNDVLYKATAAIAIGDTIVPNTNCEATNVTTEIDKLNSDLKNEVILEVLGDGVKTWKTILNQLSVAINNLNIGGTAICRQITIERYDSSNDETTKYTIADAIESATNPNTYNMRGGSVIGLTGSGAQITSIVLDNTDSVRKPIIIDGTGNITVINGSDTVFPVGSSLKAVRKIK